MEIGVSFSGSLVRMYKAEAAELAEACAAAVEIEGDSLKTALKLQVVRAGLGERLGSTWRSRFFRNKGWNASALVYSKAPKILKAFDQGAVIKSKDGFWLAIPTRNAPDRGEGDRKLSPKTFPVARYGPLRFIYNPNGASMLVVDYVRKNKSGKTGRRAKNDGILKSGKRKKGLATVVMFILVRQATLKKRIDFDHAGDAALRRLPVTLARQFPN